MWYETFLVFYKIRLQSSFGCFLVKFVGGSFGTLDMEFNLTCLDSCEMITKVYEVLGLLTQIKAFLNVRKITTCI